MTSPLEMRLRVLALLAEPMLEIARASALRLDDLRELRRDRVLRAPATSWRELDPDRAAPRQEPPHDRRARASLGRPRVAA
ncbi:MAG: hypothetical protein H6721_06700 [Sandaracinus sp.]|nr:hypothetical protein [Sandaracinus sp.]